ncbi:hypothetical protein P4O66_002674 [Electrophorus voltai]|uniref:dolichyl-diphosphooligosaccharide--protein glycotransferase n=1 Tax=Electrophorus voltai TaxID=2609070 RepID=A0AAD8YZL3_9TELE|nr:hypothetical protein P4O66_002674 [Electrophorus voltai]
MAQQSGGAEPSDCKSSRLESERSTNTVSSFKPSVQPCVKDELPSYRFEEAGSRLFNYRSTHHLTTNGFYEFLNWFDERAWYPLGRIVGGTVYPGLMLTAGVIHYILNLLHITVHIRDVCVFLAPVFSGLTAISTFLLTRALWSQGAGLLAACFIAIVPGYISRSVAGSFDNEGIAIFALQFTYYLWLQGANEGSTAVE